MVKFGVKKFVFSSSATVYGPPQRLPVDEPHQEFYHTSNVSRRRHLRILRSILIICSNNNPLMLKVTIKTKREMVPLVACSNSLAVNC